jgi:hypothetical protein
MAALHCDDKRLQGGAWDLGRSLQSSPVCMGVPVAAFDISAGLEAEGQLPEL